MTDTEGHALLKSSNRPANCESFAQAEQSSCKTARALLKSSNRPAKQRELCSSRATVLQNCESFAQAEQPSCKTARALLKPSNRPAKVRELCRSPETIFAPLSRKRRASVASKKVLSGIHEIRVKKLEYPTCHPPYHKLNFHCIFWIYFSPILFHGIHKFHNFFSGCGFDFEFFATVEYIHYLAFRFFFLALVNFFAEIIIFLLSLD
jgi:hypothetical protein